MRRRRIEVSIGELVLHGFRRGDHRAIERAMRGELARLLRAPAVSAMFSANRRVDRVAARPARASPRSDARTIGIHVARSVYGGLGK